MNSIGSAVFALGIVVVLLTGCVEPESIPGPPGEKGDRGPIGPEGPRGPMGEPGTNSISDAFVYVDGWGKLVGPTSINGYVDPDGTLWQVDTETGAVSPGVLSLANVNLSETDSCQPGLKIAYPPSPRFAFRLPTDPINMHRVRGDRDLVERKLTRSQVQPDGSCGPSPHTAMVPLISLPPLRPGGGYPSGEMFYGPLHIRRR